MLMGKLLRRSPININCPSGAVVPVNLELQMSSFAGYDNSETSTYLGTQCHGVMWPETASLPAAWPICPPMVSGKVLPSLPKAEMLDCLYLGHFRALSAFGEQGVDLHYIKKRPRPLPLPNLRL